MISHLLLCPFLRALVDASRAYSALAPHGRLFPCFTDVLPCCNMPPPYYRLRVLSTPYGTCSDSASAMHHIVGIHAYGPAIAARTDTERPPPVLGTGGVRSRGKGEEKERRVRVIDRQPTQQPPPPVPRPYKPVPLSAKALPFSGVFPYRHVPASGNAPLPLNGPYMLLPRP